MSSFLVVGLGNPGSRYSNTRHNVGTDFILEAQKKYSFDLKEKKTLKSFLAEVVIQDKKVIFAVPTIFMNHSGVALKENLGSQEFKRIRIGIDHPGDKKKVNKYVIQKGKKEEKIDRLKCIDKGLSVMEFLFQGDWDAALNKLNN